MLEKLTQRSVKLKWIGPSPSENRKNALLIPLYNESSNCDLSQRLTYFREVAATNKEYLDVIIIDDGSTDDSLSIIKQFVADGPSGIFVASIFPNANKVGALYLTTLSIRHPLIILSDFDTDLVGLHEIGDIVRTLEMDESLMGCYFRMLPYEGEGDIFHFQQFEYSLLRSLYRFHKDGSVPVMPGAGSCYKREVLLSIYKEHSGFRSGEDREATLLGLKMGYRTIYWNEVSSLTRPPLSFGALVKQRIRWNLGYLETFYKERKYYNRQMSMFSIVGIRTLMDILTVVLLVILPVVMILICVINPVLFFILLGAAYLISIGLYLTVLFLVPSGASEHKRIKIHILLFYIFFKVAVEYLGWMGAIRTFISQRFRNK